MNMNEEIRDGYVVSAEMKKVWDIQMRLMRKVLDVCRENDLNIWVDGGTLLGAVRHHGYIPWDDDIDLIMMREDYERLQRIAAQYFTPPLVLSDSLHRPVLSAWSCTAALRRNVCHTARGGTM